MKKAKLTVNGVFPQDGSLPDGCQFSCPWKETDSKEYYCSLFDTVSECRNSRNSAKTTGNSILTGAVQEIAQDELKRYAEQQELREKLGVQQLPCPSCGGKMRSGDLVLNALSRYSPAYICPECGVNEAMNGTNLADWYAIRCRAARRKESQFAASGSSADPVLIIYGKVNGTTFSSEEFTGRMDSQKFWDELAAYAKRIGAYVRLMGITKGDEK